MDDREILKTELMKLLDDIPLERLKALYIKALVASSAKVVNPDCRQGTEPREEIIAWIVEQLRKLPLHHQTQWPSQRPSVILLRRLHRWMTM